MPMGTQSEMSEEELQRFLAENPDVPRGDVAPLVAPVATPADDQLAALQAEQRRKNTNIGYIDALNTIATSIAGKQQDMGADQFRDQNAQKVRDYLLQKQQARKALEQQQADTTFNQGQEQVAAQKAEQTAANDPNHPVSVRAQALAVQAGILPKDAPAMSWAQMKQMGINPGAVLEDNKKAATKFAYDKQLQDSRISAEKEIAGMKTKKEDLDVLDVNGRGQARTKQEAIKLRDNIATTKQIQDSVDRILAIKNEGPIVPMTQRARDIETEQQFLMGALRLPLQGPGAMTDSDRKQLRDTVGDAAGLFTINANTIAKLNAIRNRVGSNLEAAIQAHVVNPTPPPPDDKMQQTNKEGIPSGYVQIEAPDGSVKAVPENQAQKYIDKGGKVLTPKKW
jgi:hypothetical protein